MARLDTAGSALFLVLVGAGLFGCQSPLIPGREWRSRLYPLYRSASDETGESFGSQALGDLYRYDRRPGASYSHLIPFYFHASEKGGDSFTLVPPFFFQRKSAFEEDGFFLLWGKSRRGSRIDYFPLWPFARYARFDAQPERWELSVFPLLDYGRDADRHRLKVADLSALLSVFKLLDLEWGVPSPAGGEEGMAFSFFNVLNMVRLAGGRDTGGYDDLELLTLLSSEKLSLFQRHWAKEGAESGRTVLFPFYWHFKDDEGECMHLWPVYGWDRTAPGLERNHLLYPFFTFEESADEGAWALECPWPLLRIMRGSDGDFENRFLPFYWSSRSGAERLWMVPPFYGRYEDGAGYDRKFYSPFFSTFEDRREDREGFDLLYPLISRQRTGKEFHHRFLPLYSVTVGEKGHFMEITPLFWSYLGEDKDAFDLLFPLYAHFGFGDDDDTYSFLPILKLIGGRPATYRAGRFQFDLLWPLMGHGSRRERTVSWLFPLFKRISDEDSLEWGFLADLVDFKQEGSKKTLTFLWFLPVTWGEP